MITELDSLEAYCRHIRIPAPQYPDFDIRRFEDNMLTVKTRVEPFRHSFFAIALKLEGGGNATTGFSKTAGQQPCLFFNSPYQILSWDIAPDWKGYYIIFMESFIRQNKQTSSFLYDFPFLRMDQAIPFMVEPDDVQLLTMVYGKIYREYHSNHPDKFDFIQAYTYMLLLYVRRSYERAIEHSPEVATANRKADVSLMSRFQALIETSFYPDQENHAPHSVDYYAVKLSVHPNHLHAIVKRMTGKTCLQLIQSHVLNLAKVLLTQTSLSIKEIAYQLYFKEPTRFGSFFKKMTRQTPAQFREQSRL